MELIIQEIPVSPRTTETLPRPRRPEWLKARIPAGENYSRLKSMMTSHRLHTVCEEARCPNMGECWNAGTATFMILGDVCTRSCGFCAVKTGRPPAELDWDEPRRVAEAGGDRLPRLVERRRFGLRIHLAQRDQRAGVIRRSQLVGLEVRQPRGLRVPLLVLHRAQVVVPEHQLRRLLDRKSVV